MRLMCKERYAPMARPRHRIHIRTEQQMNPWCVLRECGHVQSIYGVLRECGLLWMVCRLGACSRLYVNNHSTYSTLGDPASIGAGPLPQFTAHSFRAHAHATYGYLPLRLSARASYYRLTIVFPASSSPLTPWTRECGVMCGTHSLPPLSSSALTAQPLSLASQSYHNPVL